MSTLKASLYCVGLTGNIASGKSSVIQYFKELGVAVIVADEIARQVTLPGQPALLQIKEHFGDEILDEHGRLHRSALRDIIFRNSLERKWLEQLLHPLIRQAIRAQIAALSNTPYCIIEIPLLLNRTDYPYLKRVLLVTADREIQIARVMTRDHCTRLQAEAILAVQPDEQTRLLLADDVILNNGSLKQLREQVINLHACYLKRV